jgi:3-oxo-5-alpha-steroid 4-dehydrogenase 1
MIHFYYVFLALILSFAVIVFILLFYISAPYGKFMRQGWGPSIRSKWAWMIMELPSPLLMIILFISSGKINPATSVFLLLWLLHYLHRTFIYPFSQSGREKPYPVLLVAMAFLFNCLNGFVNGYGVFHILTYESDWFYSWQFTSGIIIFFTGYFINKTADEKLKHMRNGNPSEYLKPQGWLFSYISCPHYFGEIIEWMGWALLTWSLPGFAFFVFTFANLFPRGVKSHRWYMEKFDDYPVERKAVIPFVI